MQANDPIRSLLTDVAGQLDILTDKQDKEIEGMKLMLNRMETAIGMARLQGQAANAAIPGEHVMQALIAAAEQRAVITEATKTLCEIVGSLIVHVEPGAMHTVAGDVLLPPDSSVPEQPSLPGIDLPIMPGCDSDGNPDYDSPVPVRATREELVDYYGEEQGGELANLLDVLEPKAVKPVSVAEGSRQVLAALDDECPNPRCNQDKGHDGQCR